MLLPDQDGRISRSGVLGGYPWMSLDLRLSVVLDHAKSTLLGDAMEQY
jgi:hypothetical protein